MRQAGAPAPAAEPAGRPVPRREPGRGWLEGRPAHAL